MQSPTRFFLVRHGEVEESYHHKFGGRIDMDLSPLGHRQAAALAEYLKRHSIDVIYASPMKRAQQTLAALTNHASQPPFTREELREVDFGDWTGLGWDEVRTRYQVSAFEWLHQLEQAAIPNAECAGRLRSRVEPCLQAMRDEHAGQSIVVVCHGGVIRMMLSILLDMPLSKMAGFEIDYASVTWVECHPHKTEVQLLNFTPWRDLA